MLSKAIPDAISIYNIYNSLKHFIHKTPLITNETFSKVTETKNLYFKCENFQKTGSFKIRGAIYALQTHIRRNKGKNDAMEFITHSSGNHASALSYAGKLFGAKVSVVMPEDGPFTKREAVLNYGGEVTLCDGNQKAREETTKMLMDKRPMQLIHSSDNYLIIAGQSTVSYEIYKEIGDLDYIITPLGGGGLLAGSCIGTINFSPKTKTIGVEPELANDGYLEFKKNRLNYNKKEETLNFDHKGREIPKPKTIADGLRINVGRRNSEIMNHYLDDIITVDEDEIRRAMQLIWERMKIVVEPSSATTLAAVIKEKKRFKNKNVVLVLSGGNIDMRNLPFGKEKVCLY